MEKWEYNPAFSEQIMHFSHIPVFELHGVHQRMMDYYKRKEEVAKKEKADEAAAKERTE